MGQPTTFAVATTNTDYSVSTDKAAAGCVRTNATTVTCTPTAAGEYVVTVTATADKNKTKTATLVVNEVIITISPETTTIKAGETATLTLSSGSAEVNWPTAVAGGTLTPSADGKSATFTSNTPDTYTITVTAKANTGITKDATVTVEPLEPTISIVKSGEEDAIAVLNVEKKKTVQLEAKPLIPTGQPTDQTPAWAVVEGDCGTLSDETGLSVVFTATTPGSCVVTATIKNLKGESIIANVAVTVTALEEVKTVTLPGDVTLAMHLVEAGSYLMGCTKNETIGTYTLRDIECPATDVLPITLTEDFYIGKTEVSQAQWNAVWDTAGKSPHANYFPRPGQQADDSLPVEQIFYAEAIEFIEILNSDPQYKVPGLKWDLPTEAQWEWAARGGVKSKTDGVTYFSGSYTGNGSHVPNTVAWYTDNSGTKTNPVGTVKIDGEKADNELGLYDMSGNVQEWVKDYWHATHAGANADGSAWSEPDATNTNVKRGGTYRDLGYETAVWLRARGAHTTRGRDNGFRLALVPDPDYIPDAVATSWNNITK
jgi:formylglycine-generating enzyme required for sulfatase activity